MEKINKIITSKSILVTVILVTLGFFLYEIRDIALIFFTSFVIASALNPLVDIMSRKMSRGVAVLIIYLVGIFLMAIVIIPLFSILIFQGASFINHFPLYWSQAGKFINKLMITGKAVGVHANFSQLISSSLNLSNDFFNRSINMTINLVTGFAIIFTLALVVLYMLLDKQRLKESYLRFFPAEIKERAEIISVNISKKVGGYVAGQILSMVLVAVLTAIGLLIIGVDFAILLGLIAGILDIIPVVGPLIAAALGVIVAFSQKPILALWALCVYLLVQWVTNAFFRPVIFSRFLDLHPLVILFALLVSAEFLGIIGVIVAPAIAATVCILIEELYLAKINA